MPITIEATPGHASANSLVTEEEQIAYMATRLNASNWTTVTGSTCTDDEKKAMVSATRMLSAKKWKYPKASDTQALSVPFYNAEDPNSAIGALISNSVIPQGIKDGACELAFQFVNLGTTDLSALPASTGLVEDTIDVITKRYAEPYAQKTGLDRFPLVMDFIRPFLAGNGVTVNLVRG